MGLTIASNTTQLRDLTIKFDRIARAARPVYGRYCYLAQSTGKWEKYGFLGEVPGVDEWIGDRVFKDLRAADFEIKNRHWAQSLKIEKNDIKDGQLLQYGPLVENLASKASYHPDKLLFELITEGHLRPCFDGQNFFDTDHTWGESGVQSNLLSHNMTGPLPTPAEFKAAFHKARAGMLGFKDDTGEPFFEPIISNDNIELDVLVSPGLEAVAKEALYAKTVISGGENFLVQEANVVTATYLTGNSFYLLNTKGPMKPFVFQMREPLSRQIKDLDDIEFKHAKFMTEARYSAGYYAWWNAVKLNFTT